MQLRHCLMVGLVLFLLSGCGGGGDSGGQDLSINTDEFSQMGYATSLGTINFSYDYTDFQYYFEYDKIFAVTVSGTQAALDTNIVVLNKNTGTKLYNINLGKTEPSSFCVNNGMLYTVLDGAIVKAFNVGPGGDGKFVSSIELPINIGQAHYIKAANHTLYIVGSEGLAAIDISNLNSLHVLNSNTSQNRGKLNRFDDIFSGGIVDRYLVVNHKDGIGIYDIDSHNSFKLIYMWNYSGRLRIDGSNLYVQSIPPGDRKNWSGQHSSPIEIFSLDSGGIPRKTGQITEDIKYVREYSVSNGILIASLYRDQYGQIATLFDVSNSSNPKIIDRLNSNDHFVGFVHADGFNAWVMDAHNSVRLYSIQPITFLLTVTKLGYGSGLAFSDTPGIDCGNECSESYKKGAQVLLTAKPDEGSSFAGWSGACSGINPTCTVHMSQARHVTATFNSQALNALTNSRIISAGAARSLAIKEDNSLWMWGWEMYTPVQIGSEADWQAIAAEYNHNVAIKNDGSLWTWGWNNVGELGIGMVDGGVYYGNPIRIGNTNDWKEVSTGQYYTVAIKIDGSLWGWGENRTGQLGDGTTINRAAPVRIGNDFDWQTIATGPSRTVAIKTDGSLWGWGANSNGEFGDGAISNSIPVRIGTATGWKSVAVGEGHTMALRADGSLWGWGTNSFGQIGDGTSINRTAPVRIGASTDWKAIATGAVHTVAVKVDGSLWSWGRNEVGQLGDGTTTNRSVPVRIGTATDWEAIAAGAVHTVGSRTGGSFWAWGWNKFGQLGDGTTSDRSMPVKVILGTDGTGGEEGSQDDQQVNILGTWNYTEEMSVCPGSLANGTVTFDGSSLVSIGNHLSGDPGYNDCDLFEWNFVEAFPYSSLNAQSFYNSYHMDGGDEVLEFTNNLIRFKINHEDEFGEIPGYYSIYTWTR